ncbi:MAG: DNA polymerase III subunit [Phycisphaerae bacterium]
MSFDAVRYQPSAVRMLRAAVAGDHMAHAYLFVGPRGVGKGLAARELAKVLFCGSPRGTDADTLDPCDACDACGRVDRGTHPDLYWFRKEEDSNDFRIHLVTRRDDSPSVVVTESAALTPMEANWTVTILDDAELLNRPAANALLKTLEEPSPHAVLVLLCADESRLPGTILSRCQWVRFRPLPEAFVAEKVRQVLARRADQAKEPPPPGPSDEEVAFVCRFAGGSIERAADLVGTGLWDLKRTLLGRLPDAGPDVALDMAEAVVDWGKALAKQEGAKSGTAEANAVRRRTARLALAAVASAFGDAAILSAGGEGAERLVNADQEPVIQALAQWPPDAWARAVGLLADGQTHVRRYVHPELATENALVQVSRLRPRTG